MRLKIITLLLLIGSFTFAQERDAVLLWSGDEPAADETNPTTRKGWYEGIFEVNHPLYTVYGPKPEFNKNIGVIVCPGGGFTHLSIRKEGYEVAEWLNALGITAFVLEYSVPEKKDQAIRDIQRAVRKVRYYAEKLNIDPDKIGVIGFSAGGNLGARVSCVPEKVNYEVVDEVDKESSIPNFTMLIYPGGLGREADAGLPAHLSFGEGTPPMFIFGTVDDKVTNFGSLYLAQELMKKNIPVELHILPDGGHGYGLRSNNVAGKFWPSLAEEWLYKYICN